MPDVVLHNGRLTQANPGAGAGTSASAMAGSRRRRGGRDHVSLAGAGHAAYRSRPAHGRPRLHRRPRAHLEDRPSADDDARPAPRRRARRARRSRRRSAPGCRRELAPRPRLQRGDVDRGARADARRPRSRRPIGPVVLTRTCGHIYAVQQRARSSGAGIAADTAAPAGGEIDRDDSGKPTGILRETAMGLVTKVMPPPTADDYEQMIVAALRHQLSLGITSSSDCGVVAAAAGRLSRGRRRAAPAGAHQRHAAPPRRRRAGAGAAAASSTSRTRSAWTR